MEFIRFAGTINTHEEKKGGPNKEKIEFCEKL